MDYASYAQLYAETKRQFTARNQACLHIVYERTIVYVKGWHWTERQDQQ